MDESAWKKAKDVLYEAALLKPSEREAFVRRHFDDRPDICEEVLEILRHAPRAESRGQDSFSMPVISVIDYDFDELADLVPSTEIGQYTIVDRLGRGGMGQVFLARDRQLERQVALKCLLSRSSPEADRERILAEAKAAAAINHRNVASVYDVVQRGERAFMVMEFLGGESLGARLKRQRLAMPKVVDIAIQLLRGLAAAHEGGVVHGDLKPANIQLTPDGTVKILDFGVASTVRRAAGSAGSAGSGDTTTLRGARLASVTAHGGTPTYMSPEQLAGDRIDGRSDLYSFGLVLFEMATGRRPFPQDTVEDLREAVAQPALRADGVDQQVPQRLADIIAMALERRLDARYQTASDIEQALLSVRDELEKQSRRELILKRLARVAVAIPLIVLTLEAVGMLTTVGFDYTFGRTGPEARFGGQSWSGNFWWGIRSVLPSVIVATLAAVLVAGMRILLTFFDSIAPVRRFARRVSANAGDLRVRLGLHRPANLAQALAGLALVSLLVFAQVYRDVIFAWTSNVTNASVATLLPIGENQPARLRYQQTLDVMIPAFLYGLYRVVRLRRREGTRDSLLAPAVLIGAIAVMGLWREFPYQILNARQMERVDVGSERCYLNGESGDDYLLLCPEGEIPRNHVLKRNDPRVHRSGQSENVFRGFARMAANR
jgi:serine/threonine protein kinase